MKPEVEIDGLKKLRKEFKNLTKGFSPAEIEKAAKSSAKVIRDESYRRASKGPTGNLKRGQVVKALDRGKNYASAIAAVDRKIAPHAHLLEFGTSKMAARPYFRPAVESKGEKAAEMFRKELEKMVDKAVR